MGNSLIHIVEQLLIKNKISFDKEELSFQIQSHPSYPSLHAITGVLDHFNIDNVAAEVPVNEETLALLPDSFIAQIKTDVGTDLVVVTKEEGSYQITSSSNKKEKLDTNSFLNRFTGIVVGVEKPEVANFPTKKHRFKNLFLGITALLYVLLVLLNKPSILSIGYLLLSFLGVLVSISIIKQEQGIKTAIGNAFCSGEDEKKDCNAVLSSKGAKIIGTYKLSDFSLLYFVGIFIVSSFSIIFQLKVLHIVFFISLLALPITLYSIYYQYAVVKKWCMLCLSIVGILWLQAAIVFFTGNYITSLTLINTLIVVFLFMAFLAIWSFLKTMITNIATLKKDKIEFVKFKRNYTLFSNLLDKSEVLQTNIPDVKELIFGNEKSNLEIVIITNPFCGHCKPVHKLVTAILEKYADLVKIIIRFSVNVDNPEGSDVKVTSKITELYHTEGKEKSLLAMGNIYGNMALNVWMEKWGDCKEKKKYLKILAAQHSWNSKNDINFTPEILINGKSFPNEYNRQDLLFFIEELHENCSINNAVKQ